MITNTYARLNIHKWATEINNPLAYTKCVFPQPLIDFHRRHCRRQPFIYYPGDIHIHKHTPSLTYTHTLKHTNIPYILQPSASWARGESVGGCFERRVKRGVGGQGTCAIFMYNTILMCRILSLSLSMPAKFRISRNSSRSDGARSNKATSVRLSHYLVFLWRLAFLHNIVRLLPE